MWLAQRAGAQSDGRDAVQTGRVTIAGDSAAVMLDGEKRGVLYAMPGGYAWAPGVGDEVLVAQSEGECFILARAGGGRRCGEGEVCVYSDAASITLRRDGGLELSGDVDITGSLKINGVDIFDIFAAK